MLELTGICKSYSSNMVLENVDLNVVQGEIHALVGENGAGKTTLMKIIGGIEHADSGNMKLFDNHVTFSNPQQAIDSGMAIVHQELSLSPNMSVMHNIFCNRELTNSLGFINWDRMRKRTVELFESIGERINPNMLVDDLSIGLQQLVEVAKALSLGAKLLILDEPTSSLSDQETENLFRVLQDCRKNGVGVILISHKLNEVFAVSDRISVLRDGKMIDTVKTEQTNQQEVIRMMVGRDIANMYPSKSSSVGSVLFRVEKLHRKDVFHDISFDLRKGEILGFAGIVGARRTEVARSIFGADMIDSGRMFLEDVEINISSPSQAIGSGICYLTEDRKQLGLFLSMSVRDNIICSSLPRYVTGMHFLRHERIKEVVMKLIRNLDIKTRDESDLTYSLSGGNQQKVLLARWLCAVPRILIADEPTRGVDVGAKAEIHSMLRMLADSGIGVVVISSELPELLGLSDRIAVFNAGRIVAILDGEEATQEEIMKHSTMRTD